MEDGKKTSAAATFAFAFKTMLPVIPGILPTGMAYALVATDAGINGFYVLLSSLIVFAGSVQFLSIELMKAEMGLIQYALIVFLLHSRHMFFGISLFDKYNKTGKLKPLMIFALTDEIYAVLTNKSAVIPERVNEGLCYFFMAFIMYASWNLGTATGVFAASLVTFSTEGVDFALTAMFLVIMLDQMKSYNTKLPFIIGGLSAVLSLIFMGAGSMLLGCCILSVTALLALRGKIEREAVL